MYNNVADYYRLVFYRTCAELYLGRHTPRGYDVRYETYNWEEKATSHARNYTDLAKAREHAARLMHATTAYSVRIVEIY